MKKRKYPRMKHYRLLNGDLLTIEPYKRGEFDGFCAWIHYDKNQFFRTLAEAKRAFRVPLHPPRLCKHCNKPIDNRTTRPASASDPLLHRACVEPAKQSAVAHAQASRRIVQRLNRAFRDLI